MNTVVVSILLLFISPCLACAYTEIPGLFVDEGVRSLARGGLKPLPETQESLDFDSPLFLDSHGKIRADIVLEHQRTVRIYKGSWTGSHAYGNRVESVAAVPFSFFNGSVSGSAAAGLGYRSLDVSAESSPQNVFISASDSYSSKKAGLFLQALDRVSLGLALVDTDYRAYPEVPLEISVRPLEYLSVSYKRLYIDIAGDYSVRIAGNSGIVPVSYADERNELALKSEYKGIAAVQYAQELRHPENNRLSGRLAVPGSVYLIGDYSHRVFGFDQELYVAGQSGGYLKGEGHWREYRAGIGAEFGDHWTLEANYRRQDLDSNGGGIANSAAVVNFWPSLLIGNYNHLYRLAVGSDQYHLSAEYKGDRASFGFGCQYLDIRPAAELTYWRSVLLGFGNAGQEDLRMDTDRVQMLFLSFGTGYRWDAVTVNLALGQFVPLATHKTSASGSTGGSSGSGKDLISKTGEFINHNPGGSIIRFMASFNF